MKITKYSTQTSGTQRPEINTRLYTAYWSRGMAEYDGQKKNVLRIDIHLLPVARSEDRLLPSSYNGNESSKVRGQICIYLF